MFDLIILCTGRDKVTHWKIFNRLISIKCWVAIGFCQPDGWRRHRLISVERRVRHQEVPDNNWSISSSPWVTGWNSLCRPPELPATRLAAYTKILDSANNTYEASVWSLENTETGKRCITDATCVKEGWISFRVFYILNERETSFVNQSLILNMILYFVIIFFIH